MGQGLKAVSSALGKLGLGQVEARQWRKSVVLEGIVENWDQYIAAGYAAAGKGYKGVVNDLEVRGFSPRPPYMPPPADRDLEGQDFDVVVIGGGVVGCAVARELTRWKLRVAVLEKEEDVAKQTSSRNNGVIHPGLAAAPGTKKAAYNIRGNQMYTQVAQELGFAFKRCGSLVLLEKKRHLLLYPFVRRAALKKGVDGIELWSKDKVAKVEPNVTSRQQGAVYLPSTGVVAPYKVTVAYAENAVENGAQIYLNTGVTGFDVVAGRIDRVRTNRGNIRVKAVINAAGVWADVVAGYAGDRFFSIHGRKGTIAILDKKTGSTLRHVLGMPRVGEKSYTKGGGLNPTVAGNILMGPTALEVPDREDWTTEPADLEYLFSRHLVLNTRLTKGDIIAYFAGIRACTFEEDFVIEQSETVENLIHVAGIQSPGLAAAPAIAQDAAQMAVNVLKLRMAVTPNPSFNPRRQQAPELDRLSLEERSKLIQRHPEYGTIVCRCEVVSKGEVLAAINSPLPALTLDALKRRVRVGMGRCQGSFCLPTIIRLLAEATGQAPEKVQKNRPGSELLSGPTKAGGQKHEH